VIEYCVLKDRTYAWIVTHDKCLFFDLSVSRQQIEYWSGTLQDAAKRRDNRAFEQGLLAPYEKLIAPLLLSIRKPARFVFVPDGAIHGLPLSALRDADSKRFLMQEGPVSIAASAKMYLYSLERDASLPRDEPPTALLIGDPAFDERLTRLGFERLRFAASEVQGIHALYGASAEVRLYGDATVGEFLRLAPRKTIVHIAAHGVPNADDPSHSMLLLARSAHDSGAIDAEQLLKSLKLDHTRLVVLSACGSAGGLPVGPEGVGPLVRPLIGTGVPGVIGSLWGVQDATTEPLLVSFHRQYRQGSDAAEALRSAQLAMLNDRNPGLRSVLAWAPFQVIGHASSPFASPRRK
jgi:CHAT domain-containing protein